MIRSIVHRLAGDSAELPDEGALSPFGGATGWLNSAPLRPATLRGRVVLVDFWTYTCINWLRTAPYLRAWDAKYRDAGLTIVGVHTPEFGFEHDPENVAARTRELGIEYPVLAFSHCRDVVAAVSRGGGFGVLGATTLTPEQRGKAILRSGDDSALLISGKTC